MIGHWRKGDEGFSRRSLFTKVAATVAAVAGLKLAPESPNAVTIVLNYDNTVRDSWRFYCTESGDWHKEDFDRTEMS